MRAAMGLCAILLGMSAQEPEQLGAAVQSVEVPAGERLVLRTEGRGVQIYRCDRHGEGAEWTFVAPEAKLFVKNVQVGTHAAGPVWRHRDGSSVWGEVLAKAPSPHAESIPVLLLKAVKTEGNGTFSSVNYIQRTETEGGNPPESGCDAGHVGAEMPIAYSAELFYRAATG